MSSDPQTDANLLVSVLSILNSFQSFDSAADSSINTSTEKGAVRQYSQSFLPANDCSSPPGAASKNNSRSPNKSNFECGQVGAQDSSNSASANNNRGCTCKKSLCLKLYCQCFAAQTYCSPDSATCKCVTCFNMEPKDRKEKVRGSRLTRLLLNPSIPIRAAFVFITTQAA